jgi:hypothetical protein
MDVRTHIMSELSSVRPPVAVTLDDVYPVVDTYDGVVHIDIYDRADLEEPVVSLPVRDMAALVVSLGAALRRAIGLGAAVDTGAVVVTVEAAALDVAATLNRFLITPTSPEGGNPLETSTHH